MRALVAKQADEQFAGAVGHQVLFGEVAGAVDQAQQLDDALDAVQITATGGLQRAQQIDGDSAGCGLAFFGADVAAQLRHPGFAVLAGDMAAQEHQRAGLYIGHIRGGGYRHGGQADAQLFELLLNAHGGSPLHEVEAGSVAQPGAPNRPSRRFSGVFRRISIDPCPPSVPAPPMSPRAPEGAPAAARAAWRLPALLPGVVSGAALQLLQPRLWPPLVYGALLCAALALGWCAGAAATRRRHAALWAAAPALLAAGLAAAAMFAVCGLRAWGYMEQALAPALEGQDIRVTGLVAAMPQASETGTRLRLEVDSALLRGQAVRLPPRIEVGWYGAGFGDANADAGQAPGWRGRPPAVRAGERWALTVRLKAPHGMRNPHGFDYELWLWEQGVQATGYVRTGPKDAPPLRLGATWRHPVERWRQSVRDAIVE